MKQMLLAMVLAVCAASVEARVWTSVSGNRIEGEFAGLEGGKVLIALPSGEQVRISLEKLSPADRAFAQQQAILKLTQPATPPAMPTLADMQGPAASPVGMLAKEQADGLQTEATLGKEKLTFRVSCDAYKPAKDDLNPKRDPRGWYEVVGEAFVVKTLAKGERREQLSNSYRFYVLDPSGKLLYKKSVPMLVTKTRERYGGAGGLNYSVSERDEPGPGKEQFKLDKPGNYTVVVYYDGYRKQLVGKQFTLEIGDDTKGTVTEKAAAKKPGK